MAFFSVETVVKRYHMPYTECTHQSPWASCSGVNFMCFSPSFTFLPVAHFTASLGSLRAAVLTIAERSSQETGRLYVHVGS